MEKKMTVPEMSVEAWSANGLAKLLDEAATEYELAGTRLRDLKAEVEDLAAGKSEHRKYIDVALLAHKVVAVHSNHAPLSRIVRVAAQADVDRAVRAAASA